MFIFLPVAYILKETPTADTHTSVEDIKYYNKPPPVSPAGKEIVILNRSLRIPLS